MEEGKQNATLTERRIETIYKLKVNIRDHRHDEDPNGQKYFNKGFNCLSQVTISTQIWFVMPSWDDVGGEEEKFTKKGFKCFFQEKFQLVLRARMNCSQFGCAPSDD